MTTATAGSVIRTAREEAGLSQAAFADYALVSRSQLSRAERGLLEDDHELMHGLAMSAGWCLAAVGTLAQVHDLHSD